MTPRSLALPLAPALHRSLGRLGLGSRIGSGVGRRLSLGGAGLVLSVAAHALVLGLPLQPTAELDPLPPVLVEPPTLETISLRQMPSPPMVAIAPTPPPPSIAAPVSEPVPEPLPVEVQAPEPVPEPLAAAVEPAVEPPVAEPSPYGDFPHLEGAEAACADQPDCWQVPVASWRSGAGDLQSRLEALGYSLSNVTGEVLGVETGVRVYAVSKADQQPYYLNLVSSGGGLLYTMTEQPISEAEVLALQALEPSVDSASIGALTPQ